MAFLRCFLGPRVYRIYRSDSNQGRDYEGNVLENYSDNILRTTLFSLSMAWSLGLYASPLLLSIMYRKGYFTSDGMYSLCKLSSAVGFLLFVSMFIRGLGRFVSSDYAAFIIAIDAYKQNKTRNLKEDISHYDFDFWEWPVDFRWNESTIDNSKPKLYIEKSSHRRTTIDKFRSLPCGILSYIAMHTFGRMMIYPGSVGLLNMILSPMLMKGRTKLIEEYNGERFKLLTKENNEIDSLLIDRRQKSNFPNGNILVICCEGNSGFYEYGITLTPIEAGYSVLGWNHPGFGSSTMTQTINAIYAGKKLLKEIGGGSSLMELKWFCGTPYPEQELNAMDVVVQFAVSKLGFQFSDIVIYAWSIGGFSATWAAMNYPDIRGLVLDATFDDLVALAVARMPPSWKPLVIRTIRDYMDLNNAEQLIMYSGPVLLIRRTRDEIIATRPSRSIQTNRGNDLLIKLMQSRYPKLVNEETLWVLKEWVSGDKTHQTVLWTQQGVEEDICEASIASYIEENGFNFPLEIGDGLPADMKRQLLLYVVDKYMLDYDSTHCVQLPSRFFQLPWDISQIAMDQRPRSRM